MKFVTRRIFALLALYICILFGIFALQFTSSDAFSVSMGVLRASGSMETDDGQTRPSLPLHIVTEGLDFFLDSQNPAVGYVSDKKGNPLKLVGFTQGNSSFDLSFSDGVSVSFSSERRGDSDIVSVSAKMPEKYQKVALPYKITRSARLEKADSLTLVTSGKKQYSFSGATIDSATGAGVRLLSIKRSAPLVTYRTWLPVKGLSLDDLASVPGSSDADYSSAVSSFAAKALVSFKESIAAGKFTEPLVAAYVAEMGRIGMYQAAIESVPESWRSGSAHSWLTSPFFGSLERTWPGLVSKEREDRSAISRKLSENNPAAFEYPSLIPYLVDRGSGILLKDVARLASTLDVSTLTARQAAGILEAMNDFARYAPEQENTLRALGDSCERKIKSSLFFAGKALYVSDDGKSVDSAASLEIADVLIRYGGESDASWRQVGHLLAVGILSLADERGAVPARLQFAVTDGSSEKTGVVPDGSETIAASASYPTAVTDNTWYPHVVSLSLSAKPGVWAWTSAQSLKVTEGADGVVKITARFPQGMTHYLVVRGIEPFHRILIYGMDFRTDPRFETYNSSGYRYNEETKTLYLKMRHKTEYEDVVIYQGKAAESAPAPASESQPAAESAPASAN